MRELSREDHIEAIRQGVCDALFLEKDELLEAITEGVCKAFDQLWVEDIRTAIVVGVKEAFEER